MWLIQSCRDDNGWEDTEPLLISEHAGRGSWCNADTIAMETHGGKAQTKRRGLKRKEEIAASHIGGGAASWRGGFDERGGPS